MNIRNAILGQPNGLTSLWFQSLSIPLMLASEVLGFISNSLVSFITQIWVYHS